MRFFTEADGLASVRVVDVAVQDSAVWFATDRGVSRYDGVSWTSYTEADGPLYVGDRADAIVAAVDDLVELTHEHEVPVVWTTVRYRADGRDGGVFFRKVPVLSCFVGDSVHGHLAAGLHPGGCGNGPSPS